MICNFSVTIVLVAFEVVRKSIKGDLSWTSWGTRHLNPTYNFQENHYLRSTYIVYCPTYRRCKQRSSVAALACADHRTNRPGHRKRKSCGKPASVTLCTRTFPHLS